MRLSRLGTDSSLPPDYQGFRAASELGRSILAAGQPSSCRPTTVGVVRRPFKEPPLTAESGGATRAALLAMRAHRGTGSSNPLPPAASLLRTDFPAGSKGRSAAWTHTRPLSQLLENQKAVIRASAELPRSAAFGSYCSSQRAPAAGVGKSDRLGDNHAVRVAERPSLGLARQPVARSHASASFLAIGLTLAPSWNGPLV
jgi:hypothetical protein